MKKKTSKKRGLVKPRSKAKTRKPKSKTRKKRSAKSLNGTSKVFKLSPKQKRNLPVKLQKAILAHHRKKGKKIID